MWRALLEQGKTATEVAREIDQKYDYKIAMAIDLVKPTVLEQYLENIEYEYYLTRQYFGLPRKGLLDAKATLKSDDTNFKQVKTVTKVTKGKDRN